MHLSDKRLVHLILSYDWPAAISRHSLVAKWPSHVRTGACFFITKHLPIGYWNPIVASLASGSDRQYLRPISIRIGGKADSILEYKATSENLPACYFPPTILPIIPTKREDDAMPSWALRRWVTSPEFPDSFLFAR
jgi:hypothetical protein